MQLTRYAQIIASTSLCCPVLMTFTSKVFYESEFRQCEAMFDQQFNYAIFYAYVKLREQEVRNLMWICECIAQQQKHRINDGIVNIRS